METFRSQVLWREYGIIDDILPFTAGFPRADIHELIAPDILHQIIKGTFKDHLVAWVVKYIERAYPANASAILTDIDCRIAIVPPFPGLRQFSQGRGFKQWTGNDSKALMKVFLPAIADYVPSKMVQAIAAFMDFCYIVHQSTLDEADLIAMDKALKSFEAECTIFEELVQQFGAPNGLCTSITESKHIEAVKKPWRRSNRHEALGQMLVTNQWLDNLAHFRANQFARGFLSTPLVPVDVEPEALDTSNEEAGFQDDSTLEEVQDADGSTLEAIVELAKHPSPRHLRTFAEMGNDIGHPELPDLIAIFVYQQHNPEVINLPELQPFMPQVIFVELGACIASEYMHGPHGEMDHLTMTVFLLKKILL
ncbi:hypothetical protein SCLCIDRAFT_21889 [Scleroderma citrinum Foug A]|uniref:Uncharacterized protein n=1 Tax=Scleroderma citrinum Foug A TaxID=1036808 RepID=A0A0C3EDI7_9AGAM|nr:hypothetical protein SCLCIDRAFT_21889 [Scleroderma citrinum Foug A]